jgi:demethylmenaquinone methyltransferase/2-methoxy-6-polyprenyl-1,4-benzoquinol methylase
MPTHEQEAICQMFDRIASTYDQANRVLSFGQDKIWRKKFSSLIPPSTHVLDIATGTADLLITMAEEHPKIVGVGIDLSSKMLLEGQKKLDLKNLNQRFTLKKADASSLPFLDKSFDLVSCSFGIRNVTNLDQGLKEMARVLKPNGTLMILEFSLPKYFLVKYPYLFYFRNLLPFLGGMISKDKKAYEYLNRTVEAFYCVHEFSNKLKYSGFEQVKTHALTLGVATIYCARKA